MLGFILRQLRKLPGEWARSQFLEIFTEELSNWKLFKWIFGPAAMLSGVGGTILASAQHDPAVAVLLGLALAVVVLLFAATALFIYRRYLSAPDSVARHALAPADKSSDQPPVAHTTVDPFAGSGGLPHVTPQREPAPAASDWRHDAWLLDAVFYALNGKWSGENQVGNDTQKLDRVFDIAQEMRDLAAEGRYDIWGKTHPEGLYEKIPAGFWINNKIDILPVITGDKPENFRTVRVVGEGDGYSRLRVNKLVTETFWTNRPCH